MSTPTTKRGIKMEFAIGEGEVAASVGNYVARHCSAALASGPAPAPTSDSNAWIDHIIDMRQFHITCLKATSFSVYLMRPLSLDERVQHVRMEEACIATLELARTGTNPFATTKARAFKDALDSLAKEEDALNNQLSAVRRECVRCKMEFREASEQWNRDKDFVSAQDQERLR